MTENTIKYIVCDDHAIYRGGVKKALSYFKDVECIGEAADGDELMEMLKSVQPDVILLDIQMPRITGIVALPEIKRLYPNIKVIMLTMYNSDIMVNKLMQLGANAYMVKDSDAKDIHAAIVTCHEQEFYFNTMTSEAMLRVVRNKPIVREFSREELGLTDKEVSVLKLICEEKTSKEIADILDISTRTVESIKDRLRMKTGSYTTAGLIIYAVKNNIVM